MRYKAAIFTASYNKPQITEAIASVLNQDCDFPYLLYVFDNSTSKTIRNVLTNIAIESGKLEVIFTPHIEGHNQYFEGLNRFIEEVDAEYIFNMQDDDLLEPNYLSEMVKKFEEGHRAVYSPMKYIRINGTEEVYCNEGLIFPNDIKPIAGNMELFQVAATKEIFEKIGYPYIKMCNWEISAIVDAVQDFVRKIVETTFVHPVGTSPLYIHRTTRLSTWTTY